MEGIKMKRVGMMIRVKPDKLEEYKRLHANSRAAVLKAIDDAFQHNYSIFAGEGYLFTYLEYTGSDYDTDIAKLNAKPEIKDWYDVCMPCLEPLPSAGADGAWTLMEEIFHKE
jgi:L-rhamnose mutarotase